MNNAVSIVLVVLFVISPFTAFGDTSDRVALFRIERNTNANIVQYDVRLGANGLPHPSEPVVAYWVRLAEEGQVRELTWIQKHFAYGFKAELDEEENTVTLEMAADIGRTIRVKQVDDGYRALARINGVMSYIDRIFIHATGKGISTRVDYIELHGKAVNDLVEQFERFTP